MQASWNRMALLALGWAGVVLSGCTTLQVSLGKDRHLKASAQNPVVQIVCLWEQAEGRDPENVPCRGFAGQIMFLGNRNAVPVEIDGDVRIYLFDDTGTVEEQSRPIHQFDFSNDAWKIHLTKSAVGPSYSVFVPYTRRGQHNPKCTLRVRLTPKSGPTIFSETTTLPLRSASTLPETTVVSEAPPESVKIQKEVQSTMSQLAEKSSTIPLAMTNSGRLAVDRRRGEEPTMSSDHTKSESADDRLARMERLLEQMMTEKGRSPQEPQSLSPIQPAAFEELAPRPSENANDSQRFKLSRGE